MSERSQPPLYSGFSHLDETHCACAACILKYNRGTGLNNVSAPEANLVLSELIQIDGKISASHHMIGTVQFDQSERATPGAQPEQILLESRVDLAVTAA